MSKPSNFDMICQKCARKNNPTALARSCLDGDTDRPGLRTKVRSGWMEKLIHLLTPCFPAPPGPTTSVVHRLSELMREPEDSSDTSAEGATVKGSGWGWQRHAYGDRLTVRGARDM